MRRILAQRSVSPVMLVHPQFDPVAISLGPLAMRWYGLMYLVGFALSVAARPHAHQARPHGADGRARDLDDALFYGILGIDPRRAPGLRAVLQARRLPARAVEIFYVWEGGMSFHGGLLGVIFAMVLFARSRGRTGSRVTDFIAPLVPLGLAAGRLGQLHQRRAVGPAHRRAVGDGISRTSTACRAILRSSTSSRSKASCCSCCCGGFRQAAPARRGVGAVPDRLRRCSLRSSNSRASPTASSACSRSGLTMGQWLSLADDRRGRLACCGWAYRARGRRRATLAGQALPA